MAKPIGTVYVDLGPAVEVQEGPHCPTCHAPVKERLHGLAFDELAVTHRYAELVHGRIDKRRYQTDPIYHAIAYLLTRNMSRDTFEAHMVRVRALMADPVAGHRAAEAIRRFAAESDE